MAQRKITSGGIHDASIHTSHLADNSVTATKIAAGAVEQSDINSSVVLGAQGMVHGFVTDPTTGALTWHSNVTATVDGNGEDIYDSIIIGTDDMTFNVDANGHLILTIS
jgi:hypothetical protein